MASIFGGSFAQLRQQLGLIPGPNINPFPVDPGGLGFGTDYLRSTQGANGLYELEASNYDRSNPAVARAIRNNKNRIENQYSAAAAVDPNLMRDQFLQGYDPIKGLYKQLSPYERGERPAAYGGRGFRLLSS